MSIILDKRRSEVMGRRACRAKWDIPEYHYRPLVTAATPCPRILRHTQRATAASLARHGAGRSTALQALRGSGGGWTCASGSGWGRERLRGALGEQPRTSRSLSSYESSL